MERSRKFLPILLIIILGFAAYANSLPNKFLLDDFLLVRDNVFVKSASHIMDIFTKNLGEASGLKFTFYRPIQLLSYMLDYYIWKLNPAGFHLTNTILHIGAALCLFWLINILFKDKLLSFCAASLFVVYPAHTEAVTYISGRADPLAGVFILLSFILYIKCLGTKNILLYPLLAITYAVAILSRENSLILPLLLLLYHYVFKEKIKYLPLAIVTTLVVIYGILKVTVLHSNLAYNTTTLERVPGFFAALTDYIRLLFLPLGLHMEYGNGTFKFSDPKVMAGIVILSLLAFLIFKTRDKKPPVFFSLVWFAITLAPSSNIFPINAYMAEHWLYMPSMGFFLLVSYGLVNMYSRGRLKVIAIVIFAGLLLSYIALTARQNSYWKEPAVFYERTLSYAPTSTRVMNNLGLTYKEAGRREEAAELFKKVLKADPGFSKGYNNLGLTLYELGKKDEAIPLYEKAIELSPNYAESYNNLGLVYRDLGKLDKAIEEYKLAIQVNPNYANAYNNLAIVYHDQKRYDEAIALYNKAIELNPLLAEAYTNLGFIYYDMGKPDEAEALYKKAMGINPNLADAYNNLGSVYYRNKEYDKAITLFKKAIEVNPGFGKSYNNLGIAYIFTGKRDDAVKAFEKAVELEPTFAEVYNNLGLAYSQGDKKEEAVKLFEKAIELKPDYLDPYNNLGFLCSQLGLNDKAIDAYKKAIALKPDNVKAYNNLGTVYGAVGRRDDAMAMFKKAVEIDPSYGEGYSNLAITYYYLKNYPAAIEYADKAAANGFNNTPLLEAVKPYRNK